MQLNDLRNVYFLGIGGIGMSALARYFKALGANVSGYDKTATGLTAELESEGIRIHYVEDIAALPSQIDLVVYTPAVPVDHAEYLHLQAKGIPIMKRAQVLGAITEGMFTVAIAGTHGKTSITSMVTHILKSAGVKVNAFIGGIPLNSGNNLEFDPQARVVVTEADEFDRSFLHLKPNIAVISAVDADHLDIYGDHDQLKTTFSLFARQLKSDGVLIHHAEVCLNEISGLQTITYALSDADCVAKGLRVDKERFCFEMLLNGTEGFDVELQVPGSHNVENALAAAMVCSQIGLTSAEIVEGLNSFRGVKRRFEIHVNGSRIKYVDDYAHHPDELKACISAARDLWPGWKVTGLFQPHLYSRTRDFADGFAEVLSQLDEVVLLPIYPAREEPIPGIDSQMLLEKITTAKKSIVELENVPAWAQKFESGILLTMGAGNIDLCVDPLIRIMKQKSEGDPGDE